jgi:hypothetical protein
MPPTPQLKPRKRIRGESASEFAELYETLPTKPVGDGSCQLIRVKPKPNSFKLSERIGLACRGKCDGKECKISILIVNGAFRIGCRCQ